MAARERRHHAAWRCVRLERLSRRDDSGSRMDLRRPRNAGLFEHSRLPDGTAGAQPPIYTNLFTEIDHSPGWYLELSWEPADIGGFEVMRYDNAADPTALSGGQVAWHTRFWDVGFQKQIGRLTLLSQGMSGVTTIAPSPLFHQTTNFKSAYALAGYDMDKWWAAARIDLFQTRTASELPASTPERRRSRLHAVAELSAPEMAALHRRTSVDRRHAAGARCRWGSRASDRNPVPVSDARLFLIPPS